jgi:hypothetical protein
MADPQSGLATEAVADPSGPRAYEFRPARKRTCLNGKLAYRSGLFDADAGSTLDCRIHDISDGGARIVLTRRQTLPADVYLIVVKFCIAYRAKIVWQHFPARGLCFSNSYRLDAVLPPELNFLRSLWIELGDRSGVQSQ